MKKSVPVLIVFLVTFLGAPATGHAALIGTLSQLSPLATTYGSGVDFSVLSESPEGSVTGVVTPVDISLGLGNVSTSGCDAADFAGFTAGSIALLQRGTCTFLLKAQNAEAAGAIGVLIFNQGNTPERTGVYGGTLTANTLTIPVIGTTYGLGESFALSSVPVTVQMSVEFVEAPEPASLALFAMGLVGAAARRRLRRQSV